MRIDFTCSCGEGATFEDDKGTYINGGGTPDERGRVFVIQRHADDWLADHRKICNQVKSKGGK
jgi:hypothetical protein